MCLIACLASYGCARQLHPATGLAYPNGLHSRLDRVSEMPFVLSWVAATGATASSSVICEPTRKGNTRNRRFSDQCCSFYIVSASHAPAQIYLRRYMSQQVQALLAGLVSE